MINVNAPPQVNINMIKCLWQCCLFKIHYIGVQCVVKWVTDDQIFTNRINVSCVYIGEFLSVCEMLIRRLHCTTLDKMCGKLHYFPSKDAYIYIYTIQIFTTKAIRSLIESISSEHKTLIQNACNISFTISIFSQLLHINLKCNSCFSSWVLISFYTINMCDSMFFEHSKR